MRHARFLLMVLRASTVLMLLGTSTVLLFGAGTPASALTLSIGGSSGLPAPVIAPLPVSVSVSVTAGGSGAPTGVELRAPDSTVVDVGAGPTAGLTLGTSNGITGPLRVKVAAPEPLRAPISREPVSVAAPTSHTPANAAPTNGEPTPPPTSAHAPPASPARDALKPSVPPRPSVPPGVVTGGDVARAHVRPDAPARGPSPAPLRPPRISHVRDSTAISASIAAQPHSGFLSALPELDTNVMLWVALVGLATVIQWFVRSALVTRRRQTEPTG